MITAKPQNLTSRQGNDKYQEETRNGGDSNWSLSQPMTHPSADSNKCLDCLLSHTFVVAASSQPGRHPHSTFHLKSTAPPSTMANIFSSQPQSFPPGHKVYCTGSCQKPSQKRPLPERLHQQISTTNVMKSGSFSMRLLVLCVVVLSFCSSQIVASAGICRGVPCANGGHLLVDNSVWGHCRCRCPSGFVGPYCQYQIAEKRSSTTGTSVDNRRLGRSEALDRIRLRLLELSQRLALTQISNELTTLGDREVSDNDTEFPGDDEIDSSIDGPDTSMTSSYRSGRNRRSLYQLLSRQ